MKTPPISYPTVSSMKPAKVPFRDVRKDIVEEESGERRVLIDEGNITESSFSLSSTLTGLVGVIVAIVVGIAVFVPAMENVINQTNVTNPTFDVMFSLMPIIVAIVVIVGVLGTLLNRV